MKYSNEKKDLAAALRWFARLDMNEGIANHFSLAVSDDGQEFLMNPAGKYWSKIKSSDILELDARKDPKNIGPIVDETAWCIHGAIHRQVPSARCVMHLHPKYATALSCLEDPKLPAINQESMTFYNRVSYDLDYGGLGIGDEGERLASKLGNHSVLMMGQHGVLVTGKTVGEAFDRMYYFAVPDFIDFHINDFHWFIFNVADIFISLGVICLIFVEIFINKEVNDKK